MPSPSRRGLLGIRVSLSNGTIVSFLRCAGESGGTSPVLSGRVVWGPGIGWWAGSWDGSRAAGCPGFEAMRRAGFHTREKGGRFIFSTLNVRYWPIQPSPRAALGRVPPLMAGHVLPQSGDSQETISWPDPACPSHCWGPPSVT